MPLRAHLTLDPNTIAIGDSITMGGKQMILVAKVRRFLRSPVLHFHCIGKIAPEKLTETSPKWRHLYYTSDPDEGFSTTNNYDEL